MKDLKNNTYRLASMLMSLVLLIMSSLPTLAQSSNEIAMADAFRAEGKIYIVVAVILLIFAGLVVYMVRIDRKVKRLEKELDVED